MKKKNLRQLLALMLALVIILTGCGPAKTGESSAEPSSAATEQSTSDEGSSAGESGEEAQLTPAYSVEGFTPADEQGNRIVEGRDATGKEAMAVASKYEVSQVGAEIMKKGGNAVDAAVAMGFALGVCEPMSNGLGGGGIATIHTADGKNHFIDFREVAPKNATLDLYVDDKGESNGKIQFGGLASGVPGEVAGMLYMLEKYGTMDRKEIMEPAIRIAEEGFEISKYFANTISDAFDEAQKYPEMQSVYFKDGLPRQAGEVINNPKLAETLKAIAKDGKDAFYKGEIGQAVVDSLKEYGGVMTMEDLANYEVQEHDPVEGDYRGYHIISSPPPSSGGTHLIEILNMMENYDIDKMKINSPEHINTLTEIFKLAFADRANFMGDTAFVDVPLGGLTSQDYADKRVKELKAGTCVDQPIAGDPKEFEHTDTTHYSVADKAGNMVAITKTINYYFGSGVMVRDHGFMMNNQMDDFSTDAKSVNKVEPGKKPLSSMSPTIVLDKDNKPFMVIGTPGGTFIFEDIVETLSNVIDHDMNLLDAICCPKFWNPSNEDALMYEDPGLKGYEKYLVTDDTFNALKKMGYKDPKGYDGNATQAIIYQPDGTLYGVGDPRQDGKAVGF